MASRKAPTPPAPTAQRIEDAALRLFDEKGLDATSIQDICRRSGASVGSVYHHHGSKDGIVRALMDRALGAYRAGMLAAVAEAPDAHAFVTGVVRFHLRFAEEQPAWTRFIHRARRDGAVTAREKELRAGTGRFLADMAAPLARWVAAGDIRALPRELYVPLILGPAQQLVQHRVEGRVTTDLGAAADVLAEAAWRAVAARQTSTTPASPRPRRSKP